MTISTMKKITGKTHPQFKKNEIKKLKKTVKHLVALEKGAYIQDDYNINAVCASAGTITYMFPNANAYLVDEPQAMAGNPSVKLFFRTLKFTFRTYQTPQVTATAPQIDPVVRIIIFQDWANQQALPNVTDVLLAATVDSPLNMANSKRFSIKHDKKVTLHYQGLSPFGLAGTLLATNGIQNTYTKSIKLAKNKTIEYTSKVALVTHAQKGQLFLLVIQDTTSVAANTAPADFFIDARLTYESL